MEGGANHDRVRIPQSLRHIGGLLRREGPASPHLFEMRSVTRRFPQVRS